MIQPRDIRYISRLFISSRALVRKINLLPLLTTSTPACFAGISKPDPPPSPRLGGGCVPRQSLGRDCGHDRLWVSEVAGTTDYFDGSYENVAIKREQRLLADYAEHKQRKDCEAGLIIGIMGERAKIREFKEFREFREFRDNSKNSLCSNGFFGFRDYPRRGCK